MSSAQRRSATKGRRTAVKTQDAELVEDVSDTPRPGHSMSRPPKPAPPKEVDPAKPPRGISVRMQRIRQMIRDTWSEIKKITWPDGETVRRLTALVLVMATFLGLLLGGIDYILLRIFDALS